MVTYCKVWSVQKKSYLRYIAKLNIPSLCTIRLPKYLILPTLTSDTPPPSFLLIINSLPLSKPARTRTFPPMLVLVPPPPRHASLMLQRHHIPYAHLRQITRLLGAHGLHVVVVAAEAKRAVDGVAAGDKEAGAEKHEDDDDGGREEKAHVVAFDEV
jgi:hypothetical protein